MSRKLYIRVDANSKVAMGHLMRCLTIAGACRQQKMDVEFLMAEDSCKELVEKQGYAVWILNTDFQKMEEELPKLEEHFKEAPETEFKALLVDSYQVTETYLETLSKQIPVIYMDDLGEQAWKVQAVVNYNHYAGRIPYRELYWGQETKLLLGSAYTPLRSMFASAAAEYEVRPEVKDILISTGGSDPYAIADKLVHELVLHPEISEDVRIHALCGPFSGSYESLRKYAGIVGEERLCIHSNVADMAGLISQCDLAVSATGSTIYELCAVGVPTVSFYFAENQRQGAEELDRIGAVVCAGDCTKEQEQVIRRIVEQLVLYKKDLRLRRSVSARMRDIVDGRGAGRLAEEFLEILE